LTMHQQHVVIRILLTPAETREKSTDAFFWYIGCAFLAHFFYRSPCESESVEEHAPSAFV